MKTKTSAVLLAVVFGFIGIHKFYLGKNASGILYLVFFWTGIPFILSLVDAISYLLMSRTAWDERYNWQRISTKLAH